VYRDEAYKKTHRYDYSLYGDDQEESRQTKSKPVKDRQKTEKQMKNLLRSIHRHSDELLDEEE
jgi:hypothetical protein